MRILIRWFCLALVIAGAAMVVAPAIAQQPSDEPEQRPEETMRPPPSHMGPVRVPTTRVVLTPGMENTFWRGLRALKLVAMVLAAVHILLAAWVFMDIRKRGEGNGIFIALALLAGLPAAILYTLVRLGDIVGAKKT